MKLVLFMILATSLALKSIEASAMQCGGFTGCPNEPWVHCQRWRTPFERPPDGKPGENGKPKQVCKRPVDWEKPFSHFPVYVVPPNIRDTNLRLQYGLSTDEYLGGGPPPFFILGISWGRLQRPDGVFRFLAEDRTKVSRERSEVFSWRLKYAIPEKQLRLTEQRMPGSLFFVETIELPDYTEVYGLGIHGSEALDGRPTRDGKPDPQHFLYGTQLEGKLFPDGTYRHRIIQRNVSTNGPSGYASGDWQVRPTDPVGNYRVQIWAYGKLVATRTIEVY